MDFEKSLNEVSGGKDQSDTKDKYYTLNDLKNCLDDLLKSLSPEEKKEYDNYFNGVSDNLKGFSDKEKKDFYSDLFMRLDFYINHREKIKEQGGKFTEHILKGDNSYGVIAGDESDEEYNFDFFDYYISSISVEKYLDQLRAKLSDDEKKAYDNYINDEIDNLNKLSDKEKKAFLRGLRVRLDFYINHREKIKEQGGEFTEHILKGDNSNGVIADDKSKSDEEYNKAFDKYCLFCKDKYQNNVPVNINSKSSPIDMTSNDLLIAKYDLDENLLENNDDKNPKNDEDEEVIFYDGKKDDSDKKFNKRRMSIKKISKPKNKNKIIKALMAASLIVITAISATSLGSKFFNKNINDIDFDGNHEEIVVNVVSDEEKDDVISRLSNKKGENKEDIQLPKRDNENVSFEKKKIDDIKVNTENKDSDNINKDIPKDNFIDIGDIVTLKNDAIYSDVYSAAKSENIQPAYFENDMERTVSGILLTNGVDSYYSKDQNEVNNLRHNGWVDVSTSIINDWGAEGAEPISNLNKVSKNLTNDDLGNKEEDNLNEMSDKKEDFNQEDKKDSNLFDDTIDIISKNVNKIMEEKKAAEDGRFAEEKKAAEQDKETINNISDNVNKIMQEKKSAEEKKVVEQDKETINNISDNVNKIVQEKKNDKNIVNNISDNVRNIMAEKATIGDKVTIDKDVIYENIYSASLKENGLPAYHENEKVREISAVLLTKYGLNHYTSNKDEVEYLKSQGWTIKAVLMANENGLEGFEPVDNLIDANENNLGGRYL